MLWIFFEHNERGGLTLNKIDNFRLSKEHVQVKLREAFGSNRANGLVLD